MSLLVALEPPADDRLWRNAGHRVRELESRERGLRRLRCRLASDLDALRRARWYHRRRAAAEGLSTAAIAHRARITQIDQDIARLRAIWPEVVS